MWGLREKQFIIRSLRTVFAGEQWFSFQHLGKYAPSAPDIHRDIVLLPGQHDFWSPIISRGDVSGHLGILYSSETEITDLARFRIGFVAMMGSKYLEITILVNEDVAGFLGSSVSNC